MSEGKEAELSPEQESQGNGAASAEAGPADAQDAAAEPAVPMTQLGRALAELQREKLQLREKWMRSAADLDNYRKRARRELQDAVVRAEDKAIRAILPTIDNLQRALDHADAAGEESAQGLVEGVRMVQKQFVQALGTLGVTPYDSVGQPFDPELHEAIQQVYAEQPANTVAFELHKGYRRESRLVRPAMVAVSRGPAPPAETDVSAQPTGDADRQAEPENEES